MKKLIALLLAAIMVLGLVACGPAGQTESQPPKQTEGSKQTEGNQQTDKSTEPPQQDGEVVEITIWHQFGESVENGAPHMYYTQWAEKFNAEHPNIHVTIVPAKTAVDAQTAIAGGSTPDIFMNQWNNAPTWAESGAILDLTPYYDAAPAEWFNDFVPNVLALCNFNGKYYSVPNSITTTVMFYRDDILADCGWDHYPADTDELLQCIKDTTLANEDGSIARLGLLPNMPWFDTVMMPAVFNTQWIADDGVTVPADKEAVAYMFEWIQSVYKLYEDEFGWDYMTIQDFASTVSGNRATASDPILSGELAMRWNSENLAATLAKLAPDVDWGMGLFPNVTGGTEMAMLGGNVWEINARTEHPDEAWIALQSLTSPETAVEFALGENNNGAFYAHKQALAALAGDLGEQIAAAKETPEEGARVKENLEYLCDVFANVHLQSFPTCSYVNEYIAALNDYSALVFDGTMTPMEAVEAIIDVIQPLAEEHPYIPYEYHEK